MITIVVPASRPGGRSAVIADEYKKHLDDLGAESRILNLTAFSPQMIDATHYAQSQDKEGFEELQEIVDSTDKFVFILPEYNGSFPGLLKVFIDACRYPDSFTGKKAAMVGISAGTQGSALAMGHFADIMNYLGAHTLVLRLRFIRIQDAIEDGALQDEEYRSFIHTQAEQLVAF